jgi:hypothetical protein
MGKNGKIMPLQKEVIFDINFRHDGKVYNGWVKPATKLDDNGHPVSYHVVLNDVFFGNLSRTNDQWRADDQRPAGLVEATGLQIDKYYAIT